MGLMRFLIPRKDRLGADAVERAYFSGLDGVPWRSRNTATSDGFTLERRIGDSGVLSVPWESPERGERMLSTASLMEREQPYLLPLELARGTLNRLRNQLAMWQQMSFAPPTSASEAMRSASRLFAQAATGQDSPATASERAADSIEASLLAMDEMCREYSRQALAARHRAALKLTTLFGVSLGAEPLAEKQAAELRSACNTVLLSCRWRDIEPTAGEQSFAVCERQLQWSRANNLKVVAGPLLALDAMTVPDWLYLWEDDFDNLVGYVRSFVEAVVQKFRGRVNVWNCAARMNVAGSLGISEEQKLQLTVEAIETVRRLDTSTPVIVSFAQPWGEYLATQSLDLSPIHFADALVRAELGVTGLGLEIDWGYWPGGTAPRDPVDLHFSLDRWSLLGLPLVAFCSAPSAPAGIDRAAGKPAPLPLQIPGGVSGGSQRQVAEQLLEVLLSKPYVQGIFWNACRDGETLLFPSSGVFDAHDHPKPILERLGQARQEHLF